MVMIKFNLEVLWDQKNSKRLLSLVNSTEVFPESDITEYLY